MDIQKDLCTLITYAKTHDLLDDVTELQAKDQLWSLFQVEHKTCDDMITQDSYQHVIKRLLDQAYRLGLYPIQTTDERDAFEAKIMDCIMPSPTDVKKNFKQRYQTSHKQATTYLYDLSCAVNYIKTHRLKENETWFYASKYGNLGITINLAKPEKDPKEIALAKDMTPHIKDPSIPKCVICKENEQNYHHARMNLRIVPLTLGHQLWHFQYSPYQYYNEHAIILHDVHQPMKICNQTFTYLLDFVDLFPNYFIGSNADLPIVGGSILNHDHFQAGCYEFPIENAAIIDYFMIDETRIEILEWPLSTLRIKSTSRKDIETFGRYYLNAWIAYDQHKLDIISHTDGVRHQTITPIVRKKDGTYELDILLRNNRTTIEHPLGIFHPHEDVWHIKKENIGLIEAMGLAILPGRLKAELEDILSVINHEKEASRALDKHLPWMDELRLKYPKISKKQLYDAVGLKFERILEDAGVFKLNHKGMDAFKAFARSVLNQDFKERF